MKVSSRFFIDILVLSIGLLLWSMDHRASEALIAEYSFQAEKGIELTERCLGELTVAQRGYE